MKLKIKNKRLLGSLIGLVVFLIALACYLIFIRPSYIDTVNNTTVNYPQYLVPGLEAAEKRNNLLSVTFHPEKGEEYTVSRETVGAEEVTDEKVESYIKLYLSEKGLSALTESFLKTELSALGVDTSELTFANMELAYRAYVKSALTYAAQMNATWRVTADGVRYGNVAVDAWQLSNVKVASTVIYLKETVATTNPEKKALKLVEDDAEWQELLELYGLTGESWVEVKIDGEEPLRILVGDLDTTGSGYFAMVEGGDLIGVTNTSTLGGLLFSGAASVVECKIVPESDNQYAYAYIPKLDLYDVTRILKGTEAAKGVSLQEKDVFGFSYRLIFEDESGKILESEEMSLMRGALELVYNADGTLGENFFTSEAIALLAGMPLGDCDILYVWDESYSENEGEKPVKVSVRITSIDYVERADTKIVGVKYLSTGDRTSDAPYNIYTITGPSSMTLYRPNNTAIMVAMENISGLEGGVVALGLTEENMRKYGIWRHRVEVDIPYFGGGDPSEDSPTYSESVVLYISDLQPDGTYFVGSSVYNLIAQVDAEMASFVDNTPFDWVDSSILGMQFADIERISMLWNYGESLSGLWYLRPTYFPVEGESVRETDKLYLEKDGEEWLHLDSSKVLYQDSLTGRDINELSIYGELSRQMVYLLRYEGDLGMTEEEIAAVKENNPCVLRLGFSLVDGEDENGDGKEDVILRFYPYSAGRCLVEYNGVCAFYSYNTSLESIAEGFLSLLEKQPYDGQDRYPLGE